MRVILVTSADCIRKAFGRVKPTLLNIFDYYKRILPYVKLETRYQPR